MTFEKLSAKTKRGVLLGVCIFLTACSTIIPHTVKSEGASFSGGVRNSSIVGFVKDGAIIDSHGRDRYNALIDSYGGYFAPELKTNDGVVAQPDGSFHIDDEHLSKALQMNQWRKSGRDPFKKSIIDRVIEAVK